MSLAHILRGEFGQRVGSVHQRILHRLAHAWFHFVHEYTHDEETGQADNQEIAEENPQADLHALVLRL